MAIEFKCSNCGKELFAQDQYAGMRTTCPGCQAKAQIPVATTPIAAAFQPPPSATPPAASHPEEVFLIDMEDVRAVAPAATPTAPTAVPDAAEATTRCPMCAETIKAAAKKCRFCGEILDEALKQEAVAEQRKALSNVSVVRRSDAVWRGVSILATMLTNGWLLLQTLHSIVLTSHPTGLDFQAPWPLYMFNVLLMGGLFTLIRQMKMGPAHVFLTAAIAIIVCMPLDVFLGLPLEGLDQFMAEAKKQDMYKNWTQQHFIWLFAFVSGMIGAFISIPVWLTALKLTLQARMSGDRK